MNCDADISKKSQKNQKTFQKPIDKSDEMCYNMQVVKTWPIGQAVKTLASHAGNSGSIPGWVTITCICRTPRLMQVFFFAKISRRAARMSCVVFLITILNYLIFLYPLSAKEKAPNSYEFEA